MISRANIRMIIFLLIALIFISGCATLQSKIGSKHRDEHDMPPQFGYIYSGVISSLGNWCYFASPNMKHPHVIFIIAPIVFVFSIVDFPLTVLADTLFLPFEIVVEPDSPRLSLDDECNYSKIDLFEK